MNPSSRPISSSCSRWPRLEKNRLPGHQLEVVAPALLVGQPHPLARPQRTAVHPRPRLGWDVGGHGLTGLLGHAGEGIGPGRACGLVQTAGVDRSKLRFGTKPQPHRHPGVGVAPGERARCGVRSGRPSPPSSGRDVLAQALARKARSTSAVERTPKMLPSGSRRRYSPAGRALIARIRSSPPIPDGQPQALLERAGDRRGRDPGAAFDRDRQQGGLVDHADRHAARGHGHDAARLDLLRTAYGLGQRQLARDGEGTARQVAGDEVRQPGPDPRGLQRWRGAAPQEHRDHAREDEVDHGRLATQDLRGQEGVADGEQRDHAAAPRRDDRAAVRVTADAPDQRP